MKYSQSGVQAAHKFGFTQFRTVAELLLGVALVREGHVEKGIATVKKAAAEREAMEMTFGNQTALARLADACGHAGLEAEGLAMIDGVLAHPTIAGDRQYEPKLHQIRGDLLLLQDIAEDEVPAVQQEAEASFRRAVDIARDQGAVLWEARALASLCRLLHSQGRHEECRKELVDRFARFTEGFETDDLRVVRAVLEATG